jgi:hypothetical protein
MATFEDNSTTFGAFPDLGEDLPVGCFDLISVLDGVHDLLVSHLLQLLEDLVRRDDGKFIWTY